MFEFVPSFRGKRFNKLRPFDTSGYEWHYRNERDILTAIPVVGRPIEEPGTLPRCKKCATKKFHKSNECH